MYPYTALTTPKAHFCGENGTLYCIKNALLVKLLSFSRPKRRFAALCASAKLLAQRRHAPLRRCAENDSVPAHSWRGKFRCILGSKAWVTMRDHDTKSSNSSLGRRAGWMVLFTGLCAAAKSTLVGRVKTGGRYGELLDGEDTRKRSGKDGNRRLCASRPTRQTSNAGRIGKVFEFVSDKVRSKSPDQRVAEYPRVSLLVRTGACQNEFLCL